MDKLDRTCLIICKLFYLILFIIVLAPIILELDGYGAMAYLILALPILFIVCLVTTICGVIYLRRDNIKERKVFIILTVSIAGVMMLFLSSPLIFYLS